MRLTMLGTGTPAPSRARAGSSCLVEASGRVLLFDHGQGAGARLLEAGLTPADVDAVFLTHLHYDHMADYPRLLLQNWDFGGGPLQAFGPAPLAHVTERLIGPDGAFGPDIAARIGHPASRAVFASRGGAGERPRPAPAVTEVSPGAALDGPGWTVRVGAARHVQPQLDCLAYRLEAEGRAIVFGGDSGGVFAPLVALADGADVLIHMCHFLSGSEPDEAFRLSCGGHLDAAETARAAGVGTLVLTHFPPGLDAPHVQARIAKEAGAVFDGRIVLARDLMAVPLDATTPEGIE
jgi:ribonuclease BN (tRNA processing enzyme)